MPLKTIRNQLLLMSLVAAVLLVACDEAVPPGSDAGLDGGERPTRATPPTLAPPRTEVLATEARATEALDARRSAQAGRRAP